MKKEYKDPQTGQQMACTPEIAADLKAIEQEFNGLTREETKAKLETEFKKFNP